MNLDHFEVRKMDPKDITQVFRHIQCDFTENEYPPFEVLKYQLENNDQTGLLFYGDQREVAYSICAASNKNGYVLVSLFSVHPEFRNMGIGTSFMKQISEYYSDKKALIVEVRRPEDAESETESKTSQDRIRFYQKLNFEIVEGISYSIWDIPMHLMILPLVEKSHTVASEIDGIMYDIYFQLMGKKYIHKMKLDYIK